MINAKLRAKDRIYSELPEELKKLMRQYVLPEKVIHKLLWSVLFGMMLSICIEAAQHIFCLGRCEIDDVIMNTLGTLTGASSYILYKSFPRLLKRLKACITNQ